MMQHDRAGAHERRFAIVMNENLRLTSDFETCVSFSCFDTVGRWLMVWPGTCIIRSLCSPRQSV